MTAKTLNWVTPQARAAIADDSLSRPDWTVKARHTSGVIALDKNETSDPVFQEQLAEIISTVPVEAITEYPECAPYYHLLAAKLGVSPRNLLFTPGSDGAIRSVFDAYTSPGDAVVMTAPSFAMYAVYSKMAGVNAVKLSYKASEVGPVLSAQTVCAAIAEHRPKLLCLPNPDSPTGTIFLADALKIIIDATANAGTVCLIDEAYFPFSGGTALSLIDTYPNLVVTMTFAKAWGLAGLRLGFAVAHPDMAAILHKVRPMYEVNGFALAVMEKLLAHEDWVTASVKRINDGKKYFISRMNKNGFRTLDGSGNFLHVDFGAHRDAVHATLEGKVLYKPDFVDPCLRGFSRFSSAPEDVMLAVGDIIESALI
jgi:histidinol-phosphate aminotransferase